MFMCNFGDRCRDANQRVMVEGASAAELPYNLERGDPCIGRGAGVVLTQQLVRQCTAPGRVVAGPPCAKLVSAFGQNRVQRM